VIPALDAEGDPPYHPRFAEAAAEVAGDGPVVLVAHSGAGAVLPAIAERLGDRVRAAVFVDALLPHPGRSWFDTAPEEPRRQLIAMARDGRLPPWHEWFPPGTIESLVPDPAAFIADLPRVRLDYLAEPAPGALDAPCVYIRLSAAYDAQADEAERRGWPVHRLDADHLAILTRPAEIAALLTTI